MTRGSGAKLAVKRLVYQSGVLRLYRSLRHRETLTIVMFHRVLPREDHRFASADAAYTMSLEVFEACARWMKASYSVVSLDDVERAVAGDGRLPSNSLLVTFDDGWEDTAHYAVPVLHKLGLPSAVFIATNAINDDLTLWKDVAGTIWRACGGNTSPVFATAGQLIEWLGALSDGERRAWLSAAASGVSGKIRPLMMSVEQAKALVQAGAAVGAHGATHRPMTEIEDVEGEARDSRRAVRELVGCEGRSFAYPHGCYSAETLAAVAKAGFGVQFTSVPDLTAAHGGRLGKTVFGRIDVPESEIVDAQGRFSAERMAYWVAMRGVS